VSTDQARYEVKIDLGNANTSHTQLVSLVGTDKRVLDIGCGPGDLGRVLTSRGCDVHGIEIDEAAAEKARELLAEVVVADLDKTGVTEHFAAQSFDVVVLADVLEHLRNPVQVLKDAATLLVPGGTVVASIPNVSHGSVRLSLLQGRWRYTDTGLLDETHIRFYTRSHVMRLFDDAGMVIDALRGTVEDPLNVEVTVDADRLPPTAVEWVRHQPDALVYQFIVQAHPAAAGEEQDPAALELVPALPEEAVRFVDRHTERMQKDLDERHRVLTVRDHIIGLEASAASAQTQASRAERQLKGAQKRLLRKNERIKQLAEQVQRLERDARTPQSGPLRRALGRMRRGSTTS
jgi:methionine biosynthesis protein MetW